MAAEFSIVKLRNSKLKTLQDTQGYKGRVTALIHEQQDIYLSSCQLGITLTSLALGWIGEPAFSDLIIPLLHLLQITSENIVSTLSIGFGFAVITFLHIVVGEIAPKSIAIRSAEKIALWTSIPLYLFHKIMFPIIYLLNECSLIFLKMIGYRTDFSSVISYSKDELKIILDSSVNDTNHGEYELLGNTLEFTELIVADLMHSDNDMVCIEENESLENALELIFTKKYSRYPIYRNKKNNIIGIVHVKNILPLVKSKVNPKNIKICEFIRPILKVPYDFSIQDMFEKFNEGYSHFAIVTNKIGEIIGFVTLDNIVSALLGNINDEFNKLKSNWITLQNGTLLMKGSTPIYSLEKALHISIPDTKHKTISGLITQKLERIPKEKEHIYFDNFSLVIKKMRGPYVLLVKIIPNSEDN
ncbi:MAG: HlyC/CorC family transporter [Legionellales bacterium]|nr:HlyC/CorC family transporter [Legionellales bacterium]